MTDAADMNPAPTLLERRGQELCSKFPMLAAERMDVKPQTIAHALNMMFGTKLDFMDLIRSRDSGMPIPQVAALTVPQIDELEAKVREIRDQTQWRNYYCMHCGDRLQEAGICYRCDDE